MSSGIVGRRTQEERTTLSRKRILDSAVHLLHTEGYASTTTVRIQEAAGVSRGRLLHQFPSRDALLLAAVDHLVTGRANELKSRTDWPSHPAERIDRAVEAMWNSYQQPYYWAATELWLSARSNPDLREELLPQERRLGQLVKAANDAFFGESLSALPGYPMLRDLLNTSMRGVALTYALEARDPDTDPHLGDWKEIAHLMLHV
jgi:AcrR family transcriptional regulator